jgi:hypothetical protein
MLDAFFAIATLSMAGFLVIGISLYALRPRATEGADAPELDPNRYKPMERLLRNDDFVFLAANGLDRRSIRRVRAERRQIFRQYLRSMSFDFGRVADEVKAAMLSSNQERTDLVQALFKARMVFTYALVAMELRLTLDACGWSAAAIDVRPLLTAFENMCEQWQSIGQFSPAAA